jgi:maleamate amidohydrolase
MSTGESASDNYKGVWDTKIGFGSRPALLVVDFMKGYTTHDSPLYAPGVVDAVRESASLLASARDAGVPVIHTIIRYHPVHFADGGIWLKKAPVLKCLVEGDPLAEICDEVRPLDSELVITKQYASAFFGTSLAATLTSSGIDTAVIIGCSTSGCIPATAVDAAQHGFRAIVVRDCVGDRHPAPHEANLFDIDSKYGDVVSKSETVAYFARRGA